MKKTALILICAGFLLFVLIFTNQARADGATYYVNCNAATGGDGSLSTPWDAVADVNAAHFLPDDQILFARGCTFREQLTVPDSGNAGHPIIFGAYGDSGDPKPIISGADVITNWTAASGGDTGGIFIANAETNDTSQFSGVTVGGTSTFVAGVVANGSTHGYTATADGTNSALGYKTITPASTLYTRLYFRVKSGYSLNEGQDQVLLTVEDGGGTEQIIRVGIKKSSGVLTMFIADRIFYSFYSTGELVTTDAWHSLLLRYSATASGGAQAWLDGVSIGSNFSLDMSAHPADTVRVGINSNSDAKLGNGSIVYFDDIKADTASIGVVPNAPTNTYSASLSTVPRAVWQNSVQLTKETSIANIVAGSWYHDATANLLYANMSDGSNPSTKTVEAASRNNGIVITDKNYVTIDSLQAEKTNDTNKGAIWARTSTGTNTTNVTVQNSTVAFGMSGIMFQSVDNAVAYNNTVYGDLSTDLSGVYTEQLAAAHSMQSPSITYNTLHDLRFCTIQPIDGVTINTVNGTWGHNTCYNTSNYGMHFNLSTSPTIEYNLVHDGGTPTQDTHGIHWADTTGAIVRYNTVYNWKDPQNWSGGGYQADNNSDNSVIYGNIAYNNDGCGFSILNSSGVLVYNNMSYGNSQHQNFAEFCVMSPTGDGLNKASATLKNNIGFATKSGTYAVFVDANSEAHTQVIDNNLWYISSGNWWYHGGATSGINLAGGATGNSLSTWNAVSYVGTDLNTDPQLNNPGGNDFTLKSISPAIDSGTSLDDTYKLGLNPNSVWPSSVNTLDQTLNGSGWDIGAYVYSQSSAPTVSIDEPLAGTVSGTIDLSATAGATAPATVSSVQFKLDGSDLGSAITVAPYSTTWDTTSVSDGDYTLSAVATDDYSNTTTSDPISVTVHNAVDTVSTLTHTSTPSGHRQDITNLLSPTIPVSTSMNLTSLQNQIASLTLQLNSLLALRDGQTTSYTPYNFTRNLYYRMVGTDVLHLQQFLNTHGFVLTTTELGSPGNETTKFGLLTYKALKAFQASVNLPDTGFFGPMTREYINKNFK